MKLAEDLWLRGQAAQASMMQLIAYNTAFAGTATIQALKLGLTAPSGFWSALGRAGSANGAALSAPSAAKSAAPAAPSAVKGAAPAAPSAVKGAAPAAPSAVKGAAPAAPSAAIVQLEAPASKAPEPAPQPAAGPSPHLLDAPRGGVADDLTVLTGIGPKLASALNDFGIYHFDQLAALDEEGIDWLNEQQQGFRMICARHKIVEQARAKLP
jgi:predicted flap endonuclease-1-like 5' DNA nuclease